MSREKTLVEKTFFDLPSPEAIGGRLAEIQRHFGWTQAQLADELGTSQSYVSEIRSGGKAISRGVMFSLAIRHSVNIRWLLTGQGAMFTERNLDETVSEKREVLPKDAVITSLEKTLDVVRTHWPETSVPFPHKGPDIIVLPPKMTLQQFQKAHPHVVKASADIVPVPILGGAIAAGPATEVFEHEIEDWAFCYRPHLKHPQHTSAVKVRGDSMTPYIADGGMVGVDHSITDLREIVKADLPLAAVRTDEGVLVRWVERIDSLAVFKPTNKQHGYPTVIWHLDNPDEHNPIIGMVVWRYSVNR